MLDTTSDASRARVRARYRAESRFKLYGLVAIAIAAAFVLALLSSVLITGLPAFTQHAMRATLTVERGDIDPDSKGISPETIKAADYTAIVSKALSAAFPETADNPRSDVIELLSTGAGDRLRASLLADPSQIGKPVSVDLLLAADADLYMKGEGTVVSSASGTGSVTPSGRSGAIELTVTNRAFAGALQSLKDDLSRKASVLEADYERLSRINSPDAKSAADTKRGEAQALRAKIADAGGEEALLSSLPSRLVAVHGGLVKLESLNADRAKGTVLLALKEQAPSSDWRLVTYETAESDRRLSDQKVAWLESLRQQGQVEAQFNSLFFTSGDSREPEMSGILGSLTGTVLTLLVTLTLCLPIGVLGAVYLEEFAPKNWFTAALELNINNLAAVPSIVFGLLGLAVFLNMIGLPRSTPIVGGLVLALLVLPTIIIATRAALKAVPPSIREAALGIGASQQQAVFHHVLPLAVPGIMTGTIIGMAHALGETAPLLMIGMIAFIVDVPGSITDAATVLPVQIYLWSDLPERAFQARTAAAILVLLGVLFLMNGMAIWLRNRFERRW